VGVPLNAFTKLICYGTARVITLVALFALLSIGF
jgi:fumarate reductase subunit D